MKNVKYILCFLFAWGPVFLTLITAQAESKNGWKLPAHGPVNVLIVFAEAVGPCGDGGVSGWTEGALPDNANLYLDDVVNTVPNTFLSRYYADMSLGDHQVIGDFYGQVVQVPCTELTGGMTHDANSAIVALNAQWGPNQDGLFYTFNNHTLDEFDNYQTLGNGIFKPPNMPDGNIDATIVLWRNHETFSCGTGLGIGNNMSQPLKDKTVKLYGSWEFCPNQLINGYDKAFVAEYFHSLYGHNNFHTGGGADYGTFMLPSTASFSTTAQNGSASNVACGWDRNFLDWKGTRQYPISALNESGQEVVSDISVVSHPGTSTFILNDFITEGDAVRIKLPHFDWQNNGDKKNQYLWLENHQNFNEFDHSKADYCSDWQPGMHVYIQAGKDLMQGNNLYNGTSSSPNRLNDWLFPLSAEGRWDFFYSLDDNNLTPGTCAWDNYGTPWSIKYPDGTSKPNPFTGYQDGYSRIDSDQDGTIEINVANQDVHQPRYQKWSGIPTPGNLPNPTIPSWGDDKDAFTTTGQKLSISTNPSPMPVYTQREGSSNPSDYDNRTIHLNNLSVKILSDDYYQVGNSQPKSLLVEVKFDDPCITEDVRWCGNIVLKNDELDPLQREMKIDIKPNKCLTLDKGLSPTKLNEVTPGSGDFTDNSFLHLLDGTVMVMQSGSQLKVVNGSTLHVQSGATLVLNYDAQIIIDETSHICIEEGAWLWIEEGASITIDGNVYTSSYDLENIILSNATEDYYAFNSITTSGNVTMPNTGNVVLEAGNLIVMESNTIITANSSGQTFVARVVAPPYNCTFVNNYDLFLPPDNAADNEGLVEGLGDGHNHSHESFDQATPEESTGAESLESLTIFPNPAGDYIFLQDKVSTGLPVEIIFYNNMGENVMTEKFASDRNAMSMDVSKLSSGVYFLKIIRGHEQFTRKAFIK